MAFWGVEVKPGKPITHSCENSRGRLRISQATLGIGEATSKTIIQCNVGKKSPVLLCALLPNKTESCQLDLEFEESDDVIFSVIGPQSVYLTGYYVQKIRLSNQSDTESYGVDIENTHTEGSSNGSDEEKYDDSFINDCAEMQFSPRPLVNNEEINEETSEDELKDKEDHGGRHRKKYCVIESDSDAKSHEKDEDEDDFSLSALKSNQAMETTPMSNDGEKIQMGDGAKDDGVCGIEPKQKVDCLDTNGEVEGVTKLPIDEEITELPKETETDEEINVSGEKVLSGDTIHEKNAKDTIEQMQSLDVAKPERKRKKRSKKEDKTCNIQTNDNMDISENSEDGKKSKKIRNELGMVGKKTEGTIEKCKIVLENDDKYEEGSQNVDNLMKLGEICAEEIGSESCEKAKEDVSVQVLPHDDIVKEDLPAKTGLNQDRQIDDIIITINKEILASGSQSKKKKKTPVKKDLNVYLTNTSDSEETIIISTINKEILASDIQSKKKTKKKKKTPVKKDLNVYLTNTSDSEETNTSDSEETMSEHVPVLSRNVLPRGLIVEELSRGPRDGKTAVIGKKVKIYYTAMLKATGHVFESNVGQTAYQFQLGNEEIIDGWNVGIVGMRVGDKRRLTLPPSMGFGDQGIGEDVPPNSWLVYEIELVGVRK